MNLRMTIEDHYHKINSLSTLPEMKASLLECDFREMVIGFALGVGRNLLEWEHFARLSYNGELE